MSDTAITLHHDIAEIRHPHRIQFLLVQLVHSLLLFVKNSASQTHVMSLDSLR